MMLIKLEDKQERPDDFFLYAQCDTSLTVYGFSMDSNYTDYEVADIDTNIPQKCLPPSFGVYMNISEITTVLETMRMTAIDELNEEIEKLRRYITNDKFPFLAPDGQTYNVKCGEGEHRDLIKGARRKSERTPGYTHTWIMEDAEGGVVFVSLGSEDFINLANSWEDWGGNVFEMSVMMKMQLMSLRYEQIKNFDVDFTSMTL